MYDAEKVRMLNDAFRSTFRGGRIVATRGVIALGDMAGIVTKVQEFSTFTEDNDPHHEHDFGSFIHDGQKLFWKIDYYSADLNQGSPDPGDNAVTTRVLTIMLASEY